jgi:hypothetical protein
MSCPRPGLRLVSEKDYKKEVWITEMTNSYPVIAISIESSGVSTETLNDIGLM